MVRQERDTFYFPITAAIAIKVLLPERLADKFDTHLAETDGSVVSLSIFEIRGNRADDLLSDPPFATIKIQSSSGDLPGYPGLSSHMIQEPRDMKRLISMARESRLTRSTVRNTDRIQYHSTYHVPFKVDRSVLRASASLRLRPSTSLLRRYEP